MGGTLLAMGVAVLTTWAMLSLRGKLRARHAERHEARTPRDAIESIRGRARSREELEQLMADAEELTRRLAAHLDNKTARLEQLLAEADSRIAALDCDPRRPTPNAPIVERKGYTDGVDPLARRVYELADDGCATIDIARELNEHMGKVELILALRGN